MQSRSRERHQNGKGIRCSSFTAMWVSLCKFMVKSNNNIAHIHKCPACSFIHKVIYIQQKCSICFLFLGPDGTKCVSSYGTIAGHLAAYDTFREEGQGELRCDLCEPDLEPATAGTPSRLEKTQRSRRPLRFMDSKETIYGNKEKILLFF